MARPKADTEQLTIRLPTSWMKRAGVLAETLSRPGLPTSRTDVLRAALARGLDALESEHAASPKAKRAKS